MADGISASSHILLFPTDTLSAASICMFHTCSGIRWRDGPNASTRQTFSVNYPARALVRRGGYHVNEFSIQCPVFLGMSTTRRISWYALLLSFRKKRNSAICLSFIHSNPHGGAFPPLAGAGRFEKMNLFFPKLTCRLLGDYLDSDCDGEDVMVRYEKWRTNSSLSQRFSGAPCPSRLSGAYGKPPCSC